MSDMTSFFYKVFKSRPFISKDQENCRDLNSPYHYLPLFPQGSLSSLPNSMVYRDGVQTSITFNLILTLKMKDTSRLNILTG